ncbi:hypothetical protein [Mesobacillus zeae]|uniref:Uncharacterized protein n=1 Tax=Mesobacillus zeae TaxID=1917180 RepID=A0A398B7V7_9BACI|nr:hypothetical protein [Mesobacillus zeae]RID85601.1 hypothetical protein D1970_08560 [Mesobacillus zeae]
MEREEQNAAANEFLSKLSEIAEALAKLEGLPELVSSMEAEISKLSSQELHIHIGQITMNQPVLKELNYHLKSLDIKDLNGTLHIGSTFSEKKEKGKTEQSSQSREPEITVIVNGKTLPYKETNE